MRPLVLIGALVFAATGGWWVGGFVDMTNADKGVQPQYDHAVAYYLASVGVPPNSEEYFMFDLNSGKDANEQAQEMAEAFITANKEKKSLGVIGDNAEHNLQVLKQAVKQSDGGELQNLRIVVVGPKNMQKNFRKTVAPLNSSIKYLIYP